MSTNFYFRDKIKSQKYEEVNEANRQLIEKILENIAKIKSDIDKINSVRWSLEDVCILECEELHIGKRSVGWQPSFEKQEQYSSVREMKEFYHNNRDRYEIIDEYGRLYDWSDLESELINWNPDGRDDVCSLSYKDEDGYIWHKYEYS